MGDVGGGQGGEAEEKGTSSHDFCTKLQDTVKQRRCSDQKAL